MLGILCAILHIPEKVVDQRFQSALTVSPDSEIYQDWIKPPVPIYMKFYLFNVTNPAEIIAGGRPKLQERGPYVFRMTAPKTNVTFHSNHTVSYYNKYTIFFEENMSKGRLNDSLCLLNVPLASMSTMMGAYGNHPHAIAFMNQLITESGGDELFPARTPSEILFGYQDPIFAMLKLGGFVSREDFGFFMDFNESNDGEFLMHTGSGNIHQAFLISKWEGYPSLHYWTSTYANMINGTDGTFLGRNLKKDDTPYIYVPQMCRSMKLEYDSAAQIKGIDTLRFRGAKNIFLNSTINPENAGFCVPAGNCYDSGIMNLSPCKEGAPVFVSLPHFYNAADIYQDAVIGLHPNKEKHESFYFAEPKTGAVLKSQRRLQINMHLQVSTIDNLELVKDTLLPILWMEGSAETDDNTVKEIKSALTISKFAWIVSYIVICLGLLILLISVSYSVNLRHRLLLGRLLIKKQRKRDATVDDTKSKTETKDCTASLL